MFTVARFTSSPQYARGGFLALGLAGVCACLAWQWPFTIIATVMLLLSAVALLALAFRPAIEIHETHLRIGFREIPWETIHRVDRTGWVAPLGVHIQTASKERILLVHASDLESGTQLLRHLRKHSYLALLDGIPHNEVWRDTSAAKSPPLQLPAPKYKIVSDSDEAEVERMFQQLKSVGRIDTQAPDDN